MEKSIPHPEISSPAMSNEIQSALEPVYSTTDKLSKGLNSKGMAKVMKALLKELDRIQDPFTTDFAQMHGIISSKRFIGFTFLLRENILKRRRSASNLKNSSSYN